MTTPSQIAMKLAEKAWDYLFDNDREATGKEESSKVLAAIIDSEIAAAAKVAIGEGEPWTFRPVEDVYLIEEDWGDSQRRVGFIDSESDAKQIVEAHTTRTVSPTAEGE